LHNHSGDNAVSFTNPAPTSHSTEDLNHLFGQIMNIQGNLVEGVDMGVTREFTIRSLFIN